MPLMLQRNGMTNRFSYAPGGARYREESSAGMTYFGDRGFEKVTLGGGVRYRHELGKVVVAREAQVDTPTYLHRDRLGSTVALSNAGGITERRGYDAFGRARNGDMAGGVTQVSKYYGPSPEAIVDELLNLSPEPEMEWEIMRADPGRIDEMLDLMESRDLELDARSALAQLLVASIDAAESDEMLTSASVLRAEAYFATDPEVRERMVFFWLSEGRGRHAHAVAFVLGHDPAPFEPFED